MNKSSTGLQIGSLDQFLDTYPSSKRQLRCRLTQSGFLDPSGFATPRCFETGLVLENHAATSEQAFNAQSAEFYQRQCWNLPALHHLVSDSRIPAWPRLLPRTGPSDLSQALARLDLLAQVILEQTGEAEDESIVQLSRLTEWAGDGSNPAMVKAKRLSSRTLPVVADAFSHLLDALQAMDPDDAAFTGRMRGLLLAAGNHVLAPKFYPWPSALHLRWKTYLTMGLPQQINGFLVGLETAKYCADMRGEKLQEYAPAVSLTYAAIGGMVEMKCCSREQLEHIFDRLNFSIVESLAKPPEKKKNRGVQKD